MEDSFKSAQFRLYPNRAQERVLVQHAAASRFVYNKMLELRDALWKHSKFSTSKYWSHAWLKFLRMQYPWLGEVPNETLRQACNNLDQAFQNFFRKDAKHPKFKRSKHPKKSFTFTQTGKFQEGHLNIPGLGQVRCNWHLAVPPENVIKVTISTNGSGKWLASVGYRYTPKPVPPPKHRLIAYDLNIGSIVTHTGKVYKTPRALRKGLRKLKLLQKGLKRMTRGSNAYRERHRRIVGLHAKINGTRNFFHAQFAYNICRDNQAICIDKLAIANMVKNPKLSRSISDEGWGGLEIRIKQKAKEMGREIIESPRFFPSSQLCACGFQHRDLTLSDREWTCPQCNRVNNRDANAAQNKIRLVSSETWQRRWGAPRTVAEGVVLGPKAYAFGRGHPIDATRDFGPAITVESGLN
jgi:putative transposase